MRLLVSLSIIIIAVLLATTYQADLLKQYMRPFLSTKTFNNLSKSLRSNNNTIKMSNTTTTQPSKSFVGLPTIPPSDPSLTTLNPKPRGIRTMFEAREQSEGAGARVRRSIGTPKLKNLSPFLMLDHFTIGVGAGFPDHPHRGQETITYLLSGAADHEDFAGHKGTIYAGDLQFMTAGRGIVHAEMPHDSGNSEDNDDVEPNIGMQLWVDLPKSLKACEPRYRDLRADEIPIAESEDGKVSVKVISGRSFGVDSVQELAYTPVWLLDVTLQAGGKLRQRLPANWNAFAYILDGEALVETETLTRPVPKFHNVVFEQQGDEVVVAAPEDAERNARVLIVAGLPLDQPVVQYGPFVLTSVEEVRQALMDYSRFENGFERARDWRSEIGRAMMV